jgi:aspartate aminotransferase
MKTPAASRLSRRMSRISPSPTLALSRTLAELRARGRDVVDLGLGEPDFATPKHIKQAGIQAIQNDRTKYTEGSGTRPLREAVAEKFRRRGAAVDASNILVGAGGKQGLFTACQALFEEGDEVLLLSPYWVSFPEMIRLSGADPVIVRTRVENRWRPTLSDIEPWVTDRTRGLILNSPNNPTGASLDAEELLRILRFTREREIFVLFDECYEYFLYDGRPHVSPAESWEEHGDHVLISGAASKTYSMTGWRLGWAVGPAELISAMGSYQSHATANACSISQEAALAALTEEDASRESIAAMLSEYSKRRRRIVEALNGISGVSCLLPDGAFYAFADVSRLFPASGAAGSIDFARQLLERAGVAGVPGAAFGEDRCVRFSFAAKLDSIEEGMRRFYEFASALPSSPTEIEKEAPGFGEVSRRDLK